MDGASSCHQATDSSQSTTTRSAEHTALNSYGSRRRAIRGVVCTCAALMAVALVVLVMSESGSTSRSQLTFWQGADILALSSLQEAPAGTPAPAGGGGTPAPEPSQTAQPPADPAPTGGNDASSEEGPVDCSGEPGGCMGTERASKTLLPLTIFALIGACLYWSYVKFIQVPGYTEAREKQVKTVVFSPARRAYDTFGHEVAGPV